MMGTAGGQRRPSWITRSAWPALSLPYTSDAEPFSGALAVAMTQWPQMRKSAVSVTVICVLLEPTTAFMAVISRAAALWAAAADG